MIDIRAYEGLTANQQLNLFRNLHYNDGNSTELGIVANAINDILPKYHEQKAEIERLRSQVNRLKQYDEERDIRLHARLIGNAKTEAVTEFAESLKANLDISVYGYSSEELQSYVFDTIDNLVEKK